MKPFRILFGAMALSFIFSSCGTAADQEVSSHPSVSAPESVSSVPSPAPESSENSAPEPASEPAGDLSQAGSCGPMRMCNAHDPWFHSIPAGLLAYVGDEEANQWERELQWNDTNPDFYPFNEGMNIENFIIDFQISKEVFLECVRKPLSDGDLSQISANEGLDHVMTENEYYNKYSFTDEQIDALFSGDQGRVNRAFCGPLAFINEADGELYSIYWLAEHSAEDYTAAGLPLEQVWKVAALAQTEEFSSCTVLGSKVADVLYRAAGGADVEDICPVHKFLYHSYEASLLRFVGEEAVDQWAASLPYIGWETMSIVDFVDYFQIPKETFIELTRSDLDADFLAEYDGITVYSLEMIDAIYSGDRRQINEAFCGDLALVNPGDGALYTIYWLAGHGAEDYIAARLPLDQVEQVVQRALSEDYAAWNAFGRIAEKNLEQAR